MDILSFILLIVLAAFGWFWIDSLHALEVARNAGRHVCQNANLQFLDVTVARVSLEIVRDKSGQRTLRRTYRFEFSETGNTRLEGHLTLIGNLLDSVTMEPYQIRP